MAAVRRASDHVLFNSFFFLMASSVFIELTPLRCAAPRRYWILLTVWGLFVFLYFYGLVFRSRFVDFYLRIKFDALIV